jgi:hypothetical protein
MWKALAPILAMRQMAPVATFSPGYLAIDGLGESEASTQIGYL